MKYFKNNKSYALSFRKGEGTNGELVDFDCLRVYTDTGNIATTGITQISDEDYAELQKSKVFFRALQDNELVEVDEKEVRSDVDKVKAKDAEIKELKEKLKQSDSGKAVEELEKAKEESKAKDDEIKSLKKQLEALKKADKKVEDF